MPVNVVCDRPQHTVEFAGLLLALCVAATSASVAVIGIAVRLLSLGKFYCPFAERNGILANLPVRRLIALKCRRRFQSQCAGPKNRRLGGGFYLQC